MALPIALPCVVRLLWPFVVFVASLNWLVASQAALQVDDHQKVILIDTLKRQAQQWLGKELEMGGRNLYQWQIAAMREAGIIMHDDETVYFLRISPRGDVWHQECTKWQTVRGIKNKLIGVSYANSEFSIDAGSGMAGNPQAPLDVTGEIVTTTRKSVLSGLSPLNLLLGWFDFANGSLVDFCQDQNSRITCQSVAFEGNQKALKFLVVRELAELRV